ncbi:MAG: hypothetical protein FWE91_12790 [Defluviitaleaceae bacterium]|nr:hypothetical protein [Defluviitaleaceae bacterium]MCL2836935.1 hypothetical protein [Defluviitaleaceae bacterium]
MITVNLFAIIISAIMFAANPGSFLEANADSAYAEVAAADYTIVRTSASYTGLVGRNAGIEIYGRPGETYSITVLYKSGESRAAGVSGENKLKTAGEDGRVSWNWRVGTNTTPGIHWIIITDVSMEMEWRMPFRVMRFEFDRNRR